MSDTLKKLGDKASDTWKGIKNLAPSDSEFQGIKEVQNNVDSATKTVPVSPATTTTTGTANVDKINPLARYGDRPGEKRLNAVGDEIPSYDEGGDVPEDQIALVHKDEKVLPPDEAAAYRAEHPEEQHGAPAGFPGMVLPNSDNVKPVLDTEIEKKTDTDRLPTGVKENIDNAPLKTPKGDVSNPPTADVLPEQGREISSNTLKPYGQVMDDKVNAKAQEIVAAQPAPEAAPAEKKTKVTYGHLLAEQWLQRNGITPNKPSDVIPPPPSDAGLPAAGNRKGPGLTPMALPPAAAPTTAASAPTGKAAYQAKIAEYDKQYQDLMDKAATDNDPALREQAARVREAKLSYEKQHPWGAPESAHPGVLGKLGHIGEEVASRTPFGVSAIANTIPGSEGYRAAQAKGAEEQVKEGAAQNVTQTDADKKGGTIPKLVPGDNLRTAADGTREHLYTNPDGSTQWVKEGEAPAWPPKSAVTPGAAPAQAGVPVPAANIGTQPSIPAAVNAATKDQPSYTYGKPSAPKEGDQPATAAQTADVSTRLKNNPYVPKEAAASLAFPEGYKPTQNDVKERLANIKEIEDATRAGKQDEVNNAIRKMTEHNQELMTQAHLFDLEDKHQQAQAKEATNASVQLAGLYAQDNYKDAMNSWYKSGNFAKDSGLITEIVNKEHSDKGSFSGALGDTLIGGLFGPEGAAIGAGVGALTGLFAGPANGYLDTLKKQGISNEGYNAMQSYFNALPARMAYEIGVQGVAASAMRSAQLIQKVLNTVPPPNTPEDAFGPAFQNYYKPMDVLTRKKVELSAPKGYVPPKKEDLYPPKSTKESALPQGTTHTGRSSLDHKLYYLDANGKKLGAAPEPEKPATK
jgi:hypothetical protein